MAELLTLGSPVKTAYEGQANTNELSDAEQAKLDNLPDDTNAELVAVAANTAARHSHSNQAQLDLVSDGDHDVAAAPHSGHLIAVQAGSNVTVDDTNPQRPIVAAASGVTNLANTPSATEVTVESSSGTDTSISAATGSVAGVMVAADKSKLDSVETNATADQTAGEIKTAYESNADTNEFSDAEQTKLAGIDNNAEVNVVDSVNTQTGVVVLDAAAVGAASAAQGALADTSLQPGDSFDAAALSVDGAPVATEEWIQSRGTNLVTNGSATLGDNTNFPGFVFDPTENPGGDGSSFKSNVVTTITEINEYIGINPTLTYAGRVAVKSTAFVSGNRAYVGLKEYDQDKLGILAQHVLRYPASDTTLAASLNPGDTEIQLTDGSGWQSVTASPLYRQVTIYGYTNSLGYVYADYSYSRTGSRNHPDYQTNGCWANGGITGNTITLTESWPSSLGTIPAGTAVSNASNAATFKYLFINNTEIPGEWEYISAGIGGVSAGDARPANQFSHGTAYVKFFFSMNRNVVGNVTNIGAVSFREETGGFFANGSVDMTGEFGTDVGTFRSDVADSAGASRFTFKAANALSLGHAVDFTNSADAVLARIGKGGEFIAGAGTVSAPSIAFLGDEDVGFYSSASNQLSFATNGNERFRMAGGITFVGSNSLSGGGAGSTILGFRRAFNERSASTLLNGVYSLTTVTNVGASAEVTMTLLSAVQGTEYQLIDTNASNRMRVVPNTGDQIIWTDGTVVSAATGSLLSTAQYNSLLCIAIDATTYVVTRATGTWTVTA